MMFLPKWARKLPDHILPNINIIRQLEAFRREKRIPHNPMFMRVLQSPTSTRKVQKYCYKTERMQRPHASEKEILRNVLMSRINAPPAYFNGIDIEKAMEQIETFDDLCAFIIKLDQQEPSGPDPFGWGDKIDEILAQEKVEL